jgi:Uma2 family endonuclease
MTPAPATPATASPASPATVLPTPSAALTASQSPPQSPTSEPIDRYVFRAVDWQTYRAIMDAIGERHVRAAYDGENLEIMTTSRQHDRCSRILYRLIIALTEELDVPISSAGPTTLDREEVERGIEPDECFYLTNEPRVREKDNLDLSVDPPPDLAVEIDVSRSSLNRLAIYARLGIPEVWRFDGQEVRVYLRTETGDYVESSHSRHFPFFPIPEFTTFLNRRTESDENKLVRSFRAWVREQIARDWQPAS